MRKLNEQEITIIKKLICEQEISHHKLLIGIENLYVKELTDGGMGSLEFISEDRRHLSETIAEAEFYDEDNVPVFLFLGIDSRGELFELDVFKANFSPLKKWPSVDQLDVKKTNQAMRENNAATAITSLDSQELDGCR